ncbi:MAG: hypothetical protein ACTSQZ_00505 [Candidatus Thorarchaeota archaeon]
MAYPEDSMEVSGSTIKKLRRIEPVGFRSPQFTFNPTKDCVEGQILATVTFLDHQNKLRVFEVEPYIIRSVCDLLKPLEFPMDKFERVLTSMECTSEEHHLNWNAQVLFEKAKILLPSKNFYIIDHSGHTIAGEFSSTIRGFAEGKYTGKRVAVQVLITGPADGNQARVVLEGLGDDMAMIPTTIYEVARGIESWICMNCVGVLVPDEVIRIKSGIPIICNYCGHTLTIDLYRK